MFLFIRLRTIFLRYFTEMRWYGVVTSIALYISISWLLLFFAGEKALIRADNYIYWLVVTASTVGYGDFSPETVIGKNIVALFIIPVGLGLFALVLGRFAAFMAFQWRKGVHGLKKLNYENHILVIGWHDERTIHLIKLLLREQEYSDDARKIILCTTREIDNPMPDRIGFVKAINFSEEEDMSRACIDSASSIIIDNPEDDITMTAALYAYSRNPDAHMITYFKDEKLGKLLQSHCPTVEYTPSVAVEMLAKAAVDPGSSYLHHQLLNVSDGMTQYSIKSPNSDVVYQVKDLFLAFKEKYDATLIGVSCSKDNKLKINPAFETRILPGSIIYYIADERINSFEWTSINAG